MQTYLVGGAVRDTLLGRVVTERDYVVVGATPETMKQKGFTQVGKDFPVFLHPVSKAEYALARTERKTAKGYTGFTCNADPDVTLEEDLLRRDLTVNAMAMDPDGNIIDPYQGQQDLNDRILRHVSDAFSEDPLRVFRVARFAARYHYLGFTVAPETLQLMTNMCQSDEIGALSPQRVWHETKRSLLESAPQVYFDILLKVGALTTWMPELKDTLLAKAYEQAMSIAVAENQPLCVRWALLNQDLPENLLNQLQQRLLVPNQEAELAILASGHARSLMAMSDDGLSLLDEFDATDVWRREERFLLLLAVIDCSHPYPDTWETQRQNIMQSLRAAKDVDIKAILATGVKGSAIKSALRIARLQAIAHAMA